MIARLMGLDEVPPPQVPFQKPQRVLSENYLRRVASIGVGKNHSFRTTLEEKKQIKDVCQVVKTFNGDERVESSAEKGKPNLGLLVNKKPRISKEFQGSLELVDSRNGSFQRCIPNKNPLLSKPIIPRLQASLPLTNGNGTSIRRNVDAYRKSKSTKPELGYLRPHRRFENRTVTGSHGEEFGLGFDAFARSQSVTQDEARSPDTRIVVLKPMPIKSQNCGRYVSSPSSKEGSHSGDGRWEKFSGAENGRVRVKVKEKNNLASGVESIRQKSTASREILEGLSRRTWWRKTSVSTNISSLGFRGDETFAMKSPLLMPPSSCSSDSRKRYQSTFSVNKSLASAAKTHLAGRCSMTERFKEVGLPSKGSTLDELFAMQDYDSRPRNHKPGSRRHGLKDLDLSKFSKKQSKYEAFRGKWYSRSEESVDWVRRKLRKHNSEPGSSETKELKSLLFLDLDGSPSDCSISCSDIKDEKTLQDTWVRKDNTKNKPDDCKLYEQNLMLPKPPTRSASSVNMVADSETMVVAYPSGKSENEQMGPMTCTLSEEDDDSSSHATDTSFQQVTSIGFPEESSGFSQCSGTELDSLVSLEEAYQPSPISVLELPFSEENLNSAEFLGRFKDDIGDLRRYLELLKSEASETCSEGPGMAVSSDDESELVSAGDLKENDVNTKIFRVEESRDFSYLVDVLAEASLHGRNVEEFTTWHSPDCPISLSVFEALEKKYGDQMSWKRTERRLLFDSINEGLTEIILPCMGVPSWEKSVSRRFKSVSRRFSAVCGEEMIEEDLWRLLVSREKECGTSSAETMLASEFGRLDLGDEIDAISTEIEGLLFDELSAEFF